MYNLVLSVFQSKYVAKREKKEELIQYFAAMVRLK